MEPDEFNTTQQIVLLRQANLDKEAVVDGVIAATNFAEMITRAENGDVRSAKELITLSTAYLINSEFGPMPNMLRCYLARSFLQVTFGKSADIALHLKKPKGGRNGHSYRLKLRIGRQIQKKIRQPMSLEAASYEFSTEIAAGISHCGEFFGFKKAPDTKTLEGIYNEVRLELVGLYQQIEAMK